MDVGQGEHALRAQLDAQQQAATAEIAGLQEQLAAAAAHAAAQAAALATAQAAAAAAAAAPPAALFPAHLVPPRERWTSAA